MDQGAQRAMVRGVAKSWTQLKQLRILFSFFFLFFLIFFTPGAGWQGLRSHPRLPDQRLRRDGPAAASLTAGTSRRHDTGNRLLCFLINYILLLILLSKIYFKNTL